MKSFIIITLVLVGCAEPADRVDRPDADPTSDGNHGSGGDGGSDGSDGGSAYVCTPLAGFGSSCCVFDETNSVCAGANNLTCQYDYMEDNSTFTSPSQGGGSCRRAGTLALGATCTVDPITQATCGTGAWCAYDANSGTTGTGICRKLCDPLDQAAHGCSTGTCVGMLYCANAAEWPNCPSATDTHLGFCQ